MAAVGCPLMNLHIAVPEEVLRQLLRHARHSARMLAHVDAYDPVVVLAVSAAHLDVEHIAREVASLLGEEYSHEHHDDALMQPYRKPRPRNVALIVGSTPSHNRLAFDSVADEDSDRASSARGPK